MKSRMLVLAIGSCLVFGSSTHVSGQSQEDLLAQVYGQGVHAFFRCDDMAAKTSFDLAIANGSQDPRVHFFRGLLNLRQGLEMEAEEDFRTATTLEVDGSGTYDIGRALERIQGWDRLKLEKIRLETKLNLSRRTPVTPGALMPPGEGGPQVLPGFGRELPPTITNPFEDDEEPKVEILDEPADEEPIEEEPIEEAPMQEPGLDEPEAAPEVDADDPFATGDEPLPSEPAEGAAPAEEAAPGAGDDPFGTGSEDADSVFGTEDEQSPFE